VTIRSRALRLLCAFGAPLALASAVAAEGKTPAAIPPADQAGASASLEAFASQWMDRMERVEDDNRRKPTVARGAGASEITYRGYTNDFKVELRPTNYPAAPFVGLIRYGEQLFRCADAGATRCDVARTIPVTEIFRFQNGRWVY
jgi:hypothetical protein